LLVSYACCYLQILNSSFKYHFEADLQ